MATTKSADKKLTKTAFVQAQPLSLTAKEVVEKAKEAHMTITDKYVYAVRSAAKSKSKSNPKSNPKSKPGKVGRPKGSQNEPAIINAVKTRSGSVEDLLRAAASELGLSRAISILTEQQNSLRAVLGG